MLRTCFIRQNMNHQDWSDMHQSRFVAPLAKYGLHRNPCLVTGLGGLNICLTRYACMIRQPMGKTQRLA